MTGEQFRGERLIEALTRLEFEFQQKQPSVGGRTHARGFAHEAIVEIVDGASMTVSLLFSVSDQPKCQAWSTVCLVTVASFLEIDFTAWLSREMKRHGFATPWTCSRSFNHARVSAQFFSQDAILLTIQTDESGTARGHSTAAPAHWAQAPARDC
jgi:hypothetical protein